MSNALALLLGQVHGLVCPDSIFVTIDGDWKLGGLDMTCEIDDNGSHLATMQANPNLLPALYKCPELKQSALPRNFPGWGFDIWAFAVLCKDGIFVEGEDSFTIGTIPGDLRRACKAAHDERPSRRPSPRKILDNAAASFAHNPFVSAMETLENWALKVR